jgi:hypothetical protein
LITLICLHATVAALCSHITAQLATFNDLPDLRLHVEVEPNFSRNGYAVANGLQNQPAFYVRSERRIFVNAELFLLAEHTEQVSILVHEIAHAVRHHRGEENSLQTLDELETDRLACLWGFHLEVLASLSRTEEEEYIACLSLWCLTNEFRNAADRYVTRKLAGLV